MTSEKHGLEIGALNQFAEALVPVLGEGRFTFGRLLKPPEPDALCFLDGQPLHVEVAHIYGTQSDVKQLLGRRGKAAPTQAQRMLSARVPLGGCAGTDGRLLRLLTPLNDRLSDKATKKYQTSRVWLLVRSASPLWTKADFVENKACIAVPAQHPFEKIWLLCGPRTFSGLLQLV